MYDTPARSHPEIKQKEKNVASQVTASNFTYRKRAPPKIPPGKPAKKKTSFAGHRKRAPRKSPYYPLLH